MKSNALSMMLMTLLASFSLSAQTTIGIAAGASFANVNIKAAGLSVSPKTKTGITAGLFVNAPLSKNFSFQPALNFVQKGYSIKMDIFTEKANFNYLEVPVNFVYNTKANEGFFIGAGPSIAYGISGTVKDTYSDNSFPDTKTKVKFGSSSSDDVKSFDFGANALAGYKFKGGFMVSGNYNLGLGKINNDDGSGDPGTIKNKYFSIKIGYVFGGNKGK